uniref:Calmodulin n=1 Tax=Alexandrium andersonii TaxID=327968 RepID=A0A7S2I971_9DINO
MDEDATGTVSLQDFEAKLADERVIAYFNAMKLDVSDARKLFWLIDCDQSEAIEIDEFVVGCYTLQGESRQLDMKMMEWEVQVLRERFATFTRVVQDVLDRHDRVWVAATPPGSQ